MEVTSLIGLSLLVVFGIIDYREAISGFGKPVVLVIVAIFIISRSIVKTGFLEVVTDYLYRIAGTSKWITLSIFYFVVAVISGFINNTAAVSIFIPLAMNLGHRFHISPTKILLPLSYAAIFGGTLTLIGTSTNIIVSNYITEKELGIHLYMFDFFKLGSVFLLIGTIYNLIISKWLLPSRAITSSLTQKYHMRTFLTEYKVTTDSIVINETLRTISGIKDYNIQLLKIIRNNKEITDNLRNTKLKINDILIVQVNAKNIIKLRDKFKLSLLSDIKISQNDLSGENYVIVEGLIPQYSSLINKTINKIDFRRKFGAFVLAIQRQTELLRDKVAHTSLKFSDTLLIMSPKKKIEQLRDSNDLIVLEELDVHLRYEKYWWLSIIIIPFMMIMSYINPEFFIPSAIFGAVILLVLGALSMQGAYESINWQVIVMIALLIPIGTAMEKSWYKVSNDGQKAYFEYSEIHISDELDEDGNKVYNRVLEDNTEQKIIGEVSKINSAADVISHTILTYISGKEPVFVIAILYLITFVASAFMSNAAVAIILAPIAVTIGQSMKVGTEGDPTLGFLMAICFGASASFMTPIGYQTNLMVYGPGQYKFKDFLIAGLPITLIFWGVATYLIPKWYM